MIVSAIAILYSNHVVSKKWAASRHSLEWLTPWEKAINQTHLFNILYATRKCKIPVKRKKKTLIECRFLQGIIKTQDWKLGMNLFYFEHQDSTQETWDEKIIKETRWLKKLLSFRGNRLNLK